MTGTTGRKRISF